MTHQEALAKARACILAVNGRLDALDAAADISDEDYANIWKECGEQPALYDDGEEPSYLVWRNGRAYTAKMWAVLSDGAPRPDVPKKKTGSEILEEQLQLAMNAALDA